MFVYQSILVKLFLKIFKYFMGFYVSQKDQVFNPRFSVSGFNKSTSRPNKSTGAEIGRPARSTDVHSVHALTWQMAGRPTRSTVQRALLSGNAPADRAVDRTESMLSVSCLGRPAGRPMAQRYEI